MRKYDLEMDSRTEIQRDLLALVQKIDPSYLIATSETKVLNSQLGLDSLAKIELSLAAEKRFGVRLEDHEMTCTNTLAELADTIIYKQKHGVVNKTQAPPPLSTPIIKETLFSDTSRGLSHKFLKLLMNHYLQLEVEGLENLPKEGSYILAANHSSHLDTPSLIVASQLPLNNFALLGAKDYFFERKSLPQRILHYMVPLIPFDRNTDPSSMKNNMAWCEHAIKQNKNLILYPEATRSTNGSLLPFKGGCAFIAYELKIPIVPVYIDGAYKCMPKGKNWPVKGKIKVHFATPLSMADYEPKDAELKYQIYKEITHDLEEKIRAMIRQAKSHS